MSEQMRRLEREKLLLRYTTALDAGDFDAVARVLKMAEQDAELERMILEANDVMASEVEQAAQAQDDALVRELMHTHLRTALSEAAPEPPPLTVGHVMARIHADAALAGKVERETLAATRNYQTADTPLPTDLSLRGVGKLLEQLGLKVGRRFQDLFRETAIFMRMGRNQGMARLAATRRQQQAASRPRAAMGYRMEDASAPAASPSRTIHEASEEVYTASEEKPTDRHTDLHTDKHTDKPDDQRNDPSTGRPDEEAK